MGYGLAAVMASAFESELYRIPLVIERSTYSLAALVVLSAAVVSALIVARRLNRLDLVGVLKTGD
jgi:putative ABC transport system permease protein